MIYDLTDDQIEQRLFLPENMERIKAYLNDNRIKLNQYVFPLVRNKYPSLNKFIQVASENTDPIVDFNKQKKQMNSMKEMNSLISLVANIFDTEKSKEIELYFSKTDELTKFAESSYPEIKRHYLSIGYAVRDVMNDNSASLLNVIKNVDYKDSISRIVFPNRNDAESSFEKKYHTSRELVRLTRVAFKFLSKIPNIGDGISTEVLSQTPTLKALDAFHEASLEFKTQEWDRIYSK